MSKTHYIRNGKSLCGHMGYTQSLPGQAATCGNCLRSKDAPVLPVMVSIPVLHCARPGDSKSYCGRSGVALVTIPTCQTCIRSRDALATREAKAAAAKQDLLNFASIRCTFGTSAPSKLKAHRLNSFGPLCNSSVSDAEVTWHLDEVIWSRMKPCKKCEAIEK
jgi:hypothetical protein